MKTYQIKVRSEVARKAWERNGGGLHALHNRLSDAEAVARELKLIDDEPKDEPEDISS